MTGGPGTRPAWPRLARAGIRAPCPPGPGAWTCSTRARQGENGP